MDNIQNGFTPPLLPPIDREHFSPVSNEKESVLCNWKVMLILVILGLLILPFLYGYRKLRFVIRKVCYKRYFLYLSQLFCINLKKSMKTRIVVIVITKTNIITYILKSSPKEKDSTGKKNCLVLFLFTQSFIYEVKLFICRCLQRKIESVSIEQATITHIHTRTFSIIFLVRIIKH